LQVKCWKNAAKHARRRPAHCATTPTFRPHAPKQLRLLTAQEAEYIRVTISSASDGDLGR
jgi:hypothetical protein